MQATMLGDPSIPAAVPAGSLPATGGGSSTPQAVKEQFDDLKTKAADAPSLKGKTTELTAAVRKEMEQLKAKETDISGEAQQAYQTAVDHVVMILSGLAGKFLFQNNAFNLECKTPLESDRKKHYCQLKEEAMTNCLEAESLVQDCVQTFAERVKVLNQVLQKYFIEKSLLEAIVKGIPSKSMTMLFSGKSYFGIEYQLNETKTPLDNLRKALGIKPDEKLSPSSSEIAVTPPSKLIVDLATLSSEMVASHEEILICCKTLTKPTDETGHSDVPLKIYYAFQKDHAQNKKTLDDLKVQQEARIKKIEGELEELESKKATQDQKEPLQNEKNSIVLHWTRILELEKLIGALLIEYKEKFKITKELDPNETVEQVTFSAEYVKATSLLTGTVQNKEKVNSTLQSQGNLLQRKLTYYEVKGATDKLGEEKVNFVKEGYQNRLNEIAQAAQTYTKFIDLMLLGRKAVESHLGAIKKQAEERNKWPVNPAIPAAKAAT